MTDDRRKPDDDDREHRKIEKEDHPRSEPSRYNEDEGGGAGISWDKPLPRDNDDE